MNSMFTIHDGRLTKTEVVSWISTINMCVNIHINSIADSFVATTHSVNPNSDPELNR